MGLTPQSAFQRREGGLSADGVAGNRTYAALRGNAANNGGNLNSRLGTCPTDGNTNVPGVPVIDTGPDIVPLRAEGLTSLVAEAAVQSGLTQIHVRENPLGSNDGPEIQSYCRSAGKTAPALWCVYKFPSTFLRQVVFNEEFDSREVLAHAHDFRVCNDRSNGR